MSPKDASDILPIIDRYFSYDPKTGLFTRICVSSNSTHLGEIAGTLNKNGYIQIRVAGKKYMAHRLAWLVIYRSIPNNLDIDHRNGNRSDNRLSNLRLATESQNKANSKLHKNNSTGYKGVSKSNSSFKAAIRSHGVDIYLGVFSTAEMAHQAYCFAAEKLFGEFARTA